MTPNQGYVSISRRPPDIEDYIDILRRHRAWIVGPAFLGLVVSVIVAFLWPDTYVSRAVLSISPPQVPQGLMPVELSYQMAERVTQLQQSILSRTSLSEMIQRPALNLYAEDRRKKPLEDVVEQMRRNIGVFPIDYQLRGGRVTAFQISFAYGDRIKAQKVVDELVAKFMNQSASARNLVIKSTTRFLSSELQAAKERLDALDQQLSDFRVKNAGRLPEQVGVNLQNMNALQAQLGAVTEALNRDTQDKLLLQNTLNSLKTRASMLQTSYEEPIAAAARTERLNQLNRAILDTDTKLAGLREIYKDDYPDIRTIKSQLELLRRQKDELEKQDPQQDKQKTRKVVNLQAVREQQDLKQQIDSVLAQIQVKNIDIAERVKAQEQINKLLQVYQSRVEASPASEQKYYQLIREEQLAKQKYEDLSRRESQSVTADNAEKAQIGELLEVIDAASTPESPSQPNRWMIVGAGLGSGLMLGLFVAGAREMKDTSLKNLKDVRAYTNLAVLSSIPLLENALVVRRKRRLAWLAWSSAVILGIVAMSSSMYYYYAISRISSNS